MKLLGKEGLDKLGAFAVLNARYLSSKVSQIIPLAYDEPCMHEFVASVRDLKNHIRLKLMMLEKLYLIKAFIHQQFIFL